MSGFSRRAFLATTSATAATLAITTGVPAYTSVELVKLV
ncbi:twin-arginine translocation signal domain-containing protein [Nonomuraea sp. NBC_01738]|nr:twin-arginine translocation signal domain-containing protein [Nonomuraea sp. NBC_01738]